MVSTQGGKGTKDSIVGDGVRMVRESHKVVWGGGVEGEGVPMSKDVDVLSF